MTIQEAIQELKDASDSEVRYGDTECHYNEVMKRVEAFDMAIKALKQQTCEDCISRTEALRLIDEERQHLLRLNMDGAEHIIVHHARRIIEELSSATPQPKRGKWLNNPDEYAPWFVCSECGAEFYECGKYCTECGSNNGEEADE